MTSIFELPRAATPSGNPSASAPDSELIQSWNSTAVDFGTNGDTDLGRLISAAADRNDIAVVAEGVSWSYRQLDALIGAIASELGVAGASRGDLIGVLCERGLEMIAGLHAVVRIGGAFVPLDPTYPKDRIDYMVEESGIRVVATTAAHAELASAETPIVLVDRVIEEFQSSQRSLGPVVGEAAIEPDDPVYVFYTSGSTGRPKGVVNSHRGVVNQLLWMQERFRLGSGNRVLVKTPFTFDVSVWEFFWPLLTGATLVVAEPNGHRDPAYLVETINQYEIDTIQFVPSMLRVFLDHPAVSSCSSLRRVISIGEALTKDVVDRFFEVLPGVELHNLYGPTEAAIAVSWWECNPGHTDSVVSIGSPIANTTLHVVDQELRTLPVGSEGELLIGGTQVALGYVNRPELTAERFLTHPEFGRVYRTGDLARWRSDGTIEFLGRLDFQVKIRGQRIELGEIEATLGEHPDVLEAVVTVVNPATEPQLVAHVIARSRQPSIPELRASLAEKLPPAMIPDFFVLHEELPHTSNGKVDRKTLTAWELPRPQATSGATEAGKNDLEDYLARIWAELLGLPAVGRSDRVFDLGATSLKAAGFVNQVQRELAETIFVATVFTAPTVADYARFLTKEYPAAIARRFGLTAPASIENGHGQITARSLEVFEAVIPTFGPYPSWAEGPKNHSMAFILSPPRSGTTLLRVMLAGHPQLFAAAELQLLAFDTLAARRDTYQGRYAGWLDGTIRVLRELEGCDAAGAIALMAEQEDAGLTAKQFYWYLQDRMGGRVLIDKTPTDSLSIDVLRNAERGFEQPRYIHLLREPTAMARSFESYHMDQILYLGEHQFSARQLGELVWTISHRNILAFAGEVEPGRFLQIRFEDLVNGPEKTMRTIAEFLRVDYHPNLVDPYHDIGSKMVDGVHPESAPMGDTRLLQHSRIDPSMARPDTATDLVLGLPTVRIAAELGYGSERVIARRRFAEQTRGRRMARTGTVDE